MSAFAGVPEFFDGDGLIRGMAWQKGQSGEGAPALSGADRCFAEGFCTQQVGCGNLNEPKFQEFGSNWALLANASDTLISHGRTKHQRGLQPRRA